MKENRKYLLVLIGLHLAIVLPLVFLLNIWMDEASTLHTTGNGFQYALSNTLADEKQAPLYFWILSLWRTIDGSIFFARLFSIICSVVAINSFHRLIIKLIEPKVVFGATAAFALHPYLIWMSLEIRVYSLIVLLSIWLLNLFVESYFRDDEKSDKSWKSIKRKSQIYFILLAIFALYTNYYLGFLLVGNFAALLVLRKWQVAQRYFLQMLIVGLAFLPLAWAIKSQLTAHTSGFQAEKSLLEGLQTIWGFFLTFALPTEIFTPEISTSVSVLRVWLVRTAIVLVGVWLAKNWRKISADTLAFSAIAGTTFVFLFLAYFLLGAAFVEIRHAAVLFAPSLGLFALVLREVFVGGKLLERRKWLLSLLGILLACFYSYSIYMLYPNLAKRGDWTRIGQFIEQNELPNQPIIVFTTFEALVLPYHYHGANRILPDEKFFEFVPEDAPGSANRYKGQIKFVISKIPPDARELWLVTGENCREDACQPLENFVFQNYTVVEEKDFYQEKLRLLRKK